MNKLKPNIAGLPEWLQEKVKAYKQGFYLDENGSSYEMGGYGDEFDCLGCFNEIMDNILNNSKSWSQCRKALLFLGCSRSQINYLWFDFSRKK